MPAAVSVRIILSSQIGHFSTSALRSDSLRQRQGKRESGAIHQSLGAPGWPVSAAADLVPADRKIAFAENALHSWFTPGFFPATAKIVLSERESFVAKESDA
jgi:hypothetical protein